MHWSRISRLSKCDDEWDCITCFHRLPHLLFGLGRVYQHDWTLSQQQRPGSSTSCPALLSEVKHVSGGLNWSQRAGDESDEHLSGDVISSERWWPAPAVWVHWGTLQHLSEGVSAHTTAAEKRLVTYSAFISPWWRSQWRSNRADSTSPTERGSILPIRLRDKVGEK